MEKPERDRIRNVYEVYGNSLMSAHMLEVSLFVVGTVIIFEGMRGSKVILLRQCTCWVPPHHPPPC